ncbi:dTDP-4-dehydrorhamnose 3,5-epimerase [Falsiroseomonas selenitidurans]|uniref:dTDP-4-dehydrorhamnose 3,5-epimerase n=1 Tax=Falsiroseomonas selenitidurans TaxID=2716335 RepID=A0ABX1E5Q0_9PROT|nr:dTDP-4-dehydrorhamnose 3,5-epimerase [Falsiroseomonas selenitidurans]NKC32070.1 dTDP-4-dehydrorhamnose 3,5-epimerase [Falsiroseomonas selenitidurans]
MKVTPQAIPDVLLIEPARFGDARGFFSEVWKRSALAAQGLDVTFVQDNHSLSREVGVLRGLHFQRAPAAQGKLVRVVRGRVLDVAVDIREGSPTYGRHVAVELSAENWRQLWVPRGFAHGFLTLEPDCEVLYKVDAEYSREHDGGILWNDPALGIDWPLPPGGPVLSDKDRAAPKLADVAPVFPKGAV